MTVKLKTKGLIIKKLKRIKEHIDTLISCLENPDTASYKEFIKNGGYFWSMRSAWGFNKIVELLGYTLITKTRALEMGYELKKGAKPLYWTRRMDIPDYYEVKPYNVYRLYLLEVHFKQKGGNENV